MVLIRLIVLQGLLHNVRITAKHVAGKRNVWADLISRQKVGKFLSLAAGRVNTMPIPIPAKLWPMQDLWLKGN